MGDDGATASSEPAPVAEAPAEAGYPPLQSVPPRPRLSYTVQQQRQIVEALIADRENARYTSQVVRYRSGLSSLPPPPVPPEPAPTLDIEPAIGAQPAGPRREEQETLVDFLNALLFDEPAAAPVGEPDPARGNEDAAVSPQALHAPPVDGARRPAPLPPGQSAVAARLAGGPDLIDTLVDARVAQMPLPPGKFALAARLAAAERAGTGAGPLPAPRPAMARSADAALPADPPAPPPIKPIVRISAPIPPRPVEKPVYDRSAAVHDVGAPQAFSDKLSARTVAIIAEAAG